MKIWNPTIRLLLVGVVAVVAFGADAFAGKPDCDRPKFCPMLWAPVICDDGKVYPNECYAQKKCATGCVPYGDWLLGEGGKPDCDRPKFCPKLWAPVICDDGKVYPNDCYAQKKCATGCVPCDEGLSAGGEEKKPVGGDDECPRKGFHCPMVWDPVICDDGEVYSNSCVAWVWCATGCVPYGDGGPIPVEGGKPDCDRPKICPKLWAPVICDDGKVYPNECYAQKKCATGCVPYGDWLFPEGGKPDCDRPKVCPKLWAPVICDDGKVYPNDCYAQKKCATSCVPYDE